MFHLSESKKSGWIAHKKICDSKKVENGASVYLPIALFLSGITVAKNGNIIIGLSGVYVPFYLSGIKKSQRKFWREIFMPGNLTIKCVQIALL